MRFVFVPMLAIALATTIPAQNSRRIDVKNLYPAAGALVVWVDPNPAGVPSGVLGTCSGTLIHERVFLTAGHCTRPSESGLPPFIHVFVTFNLHVFDDSSSWVPVAGQVWHPSTLPCPNQTCNWPPPPIPGLSDVGLVFLKEPVTWIQPAELAQPGALDTVQGKDQIIVGYGFTAPAQGGDFPLSEWDGIRRYRLKPLNRILDERSAVWALPSEICAGDSGGGIFLGPLPDSGIRPPTIVATVAAGGADCRSASYHMRIDNEEVQSWITQQIQQFLAKQ